MAKVINGIKCNSCENIAYPKRLFCPKCHSRDVKPEIIPNQGTIYTHTTIRYPLHNGKQRCYPLSNNKCSNENYRRLKHLFKFICLRFFPKYGRQDGASRRRKRVTVEGTKQNMRLLRKKGRFYYNHRDEHA